jgi:putative thioredoxin
MSLPPNFGQAFDLSSLTKPKVDPSVPMAGIEVNVENLSTEVLPLSLVRPVIVLMWTSRSPESVGMVKTLGKLESDYKSAFALARVDIDTHPEVAKAFQTKSVPYAVAIIAEQMVPLFEQAYPEAQVKMVIDKVLTLASEQGVGQAPVEVIEPEETEAMNALEKGDYTAAEAAYKKWLARKPADDLAKLGLAQTQLLIRTEGLELNTVVAQANAAPTDLDHALRAADVEMAHGGVEAAFTRLLVAITATSGEERIKVKNHLLTLFALVDPTDPRLVAARKELASALF